MKRSEESKTARSVLGGLRADPEQGTLTAFDERFLVIPVKLIHSIEDKLVRSFGPATATMFEYEIGKEGGAQYMRLATEAGYKTSSSDDVRNMFQQGGLSGWGKIEVVEFDFAKKFARVRWTNGVDVRNSKAKKPVCHFVRGLLTGATQTLFGKACESLEVTCQGKGDDVCEAIVGDAKIIARLANNSKHYPLFSPRCSFRHDILAESVRFLQDPDRENKATVSPDRQEEPRLGLSRTQAPSSGPSRTTKPAQCNGCLTAD